MSIIVAGKLSIKPDQRDQFIEQSLKSVILARKNKACHDFAVSPDPVDENRVNIYEKWANLESLEAFRESGPEDDLFVFVESFDVLEYVVSDNTPNI